MRGLKAEWVALTTTRALVGHLAVAALLGLLPLLVIIVSSSEEAQAQGAPGLASATDQAAIVATSQFAFLLAAILGAVIATRRYRHLTIVPHLLVAPRRVRTMLAQTTMAAVAGVLIGAVGIGTAIAAVTGGLAVQDIPFAVDGAGVARLVAVALLAGGVGACIGSGVGAVVRSSGVAITVVVLFVFVVESLIAGFLPEVGQWLPSSLLSRLEVPGGPTRGVAGVEAPLSIVVLLAYAAVAVVAGTLATTRRDAV